MKVKTHGIITLGLAGALIGGSLAGVTLPASEAIGKTGLMMAADGRDSNVDTQQDAATDEIKVSFKQYIAYDKATVEKSKSSASSATDSNGKASNAAVKFLKGKWYSASCGEGGPNWYVVFTKKYAKRYMYDTKKKKYVYERKGIIKSTKKVASGYRIKIKDGKNKYTYQSAKDDKNVLDFYGTWKTSEFSSTYSGSSSLAR